MQNFESMLNALCQKYLSDSLPERHSPAERLEQAYLRAYCLWRNAETDAFSLALSELETLFSEGSSFPLWKLEILKLAVSQNLSQMEQICFKLLNQFHSRLSLQILKQFLEFYFPEWDIGLLWAGASAYLGRQGNFPAAQQAFNQAKTSLYPLQVFAWWAFVLWESPERFKVWQWLGSNSILALPAGWLLHWFQHLRAQGYASEALNLLERAWAQQAEPSLGPYLAAAYEEQGAYLKALALYPDLPQLPENIQRQAEVYKALGKTDQAALLLSQALAAYDKKQAISLASTLSWARLYSQYLICLESLAETLPEQRELAFQGWNHRFAVAQKRAASSPRTDGKLRVGYLSPDFGLHSTFPMIQTLWTQHNRSRIEIWAYSGRERHDLATQQLQALSDHWLDLSFSDPALMAERLAADQLDILIDLSGHTSQSLLALMAYQPAPIQISGLCFNTETALSAIQYRFTDRLSTPQAQDTLQSELPLFLSSWIYWSVPQQPVPLEETTERLHLACLHHPGRISVKICELWAQILHAFPRSMLIFKHACFRSADTRQVFRERFQQWGIASERLVFECSSAYYDYLAFYNRLALVLDAYPYHGGLTTCEALWMGVPVLALEGPMRGNQSLLAQVGHREWCAASEAEFLAQAAQLLTQPFQLKDRQALRAKVLAAPFAHPEQIIREIETQLFQICSFTT
ncbi:hypothetical protein COW36_12140 [bacterium (Candidatus Blackallbacteria) CG17_big_fil_post_rev_8_21_14_2_50_48_46]|uniref:O-GlcNAc transferase C-terminal domain-containing protein n=1 Tax=bacterium (Candidatus Blackallbacteria) CG17_big_fil_post_rev_8_21_14_2_50_48_46 TaxID=2014261 RepID=A0A2M7G3S0_9BACT|nr:MAG: hypothetical protein COW64_03120 [bacterium (Candidatus Blackallbacteria) CG18_big_fil_WC_8_21_14_2_50_49_26]PIW16509.1 MAG: hypothetical protein COW36_12140 [bacterium (Candidatus Blackallbacteria) CG17_big_fil_post_rev_8_21_14_2_50_48_46]PIW46017.1 MAG: hypothetical protein COW20_17405 [bacterium (Candidatus Blackallbacteria) CG13_big_fil_rev_8_21_14_2_50_49_14]